MQKGIEAKKIYDKQIDGLKIFYLVRANSVLLRSRRYEGSSSRYFT